MLAPPPKQLTPEERLMDRPALSAPLRPLTSLLSPLCLVLGGLGSLVACDDENRPPSLLPLQELSWRSNVAQTLELIGADPDGDSLSFAFELSPPPPTVTEGLTGAPSIVSITGQRSLFQWTPGAADTGTYSLTVTVKDPSGASAQESVGLTVTSSGIAGGVGGAQLSFVEPAGAGLSVERSATGQSCINGLPVVVRAEAVPDEEVVIELREPSPEGARLSPPSGSPGKESSLSWCPSEAQLDAQERFTFSLYAYRLGAEDAGLTKRFLVRFSRPNRDDCPGDPPVIEHQVVAEQSGLADYPIDVHILDDFGVKSPPLLAYLVSPREDPRVSPVEGWTLTEFEAHEPAAGAPDIGSYWRATIPNLNLAEGQSAPIYYRVIATDNDDASGAACDQTTESPVYLMTALGGGEGVAGGLCSPCSHSGQCGESPDDLCLSYEEGQFCGLACDPNADRCPAGSGCYELVTSEGDTTFQCLPLTGACVSQCTPDDYDALGDDTIPVLEPARYASLAICREQVDYYWVPLQPDGGLSVELLFSDPLLDLDLAVALDFDEQGSPIFDYESARADSVTERVELPCVGGAQDALVAVYPYGVGEGPYTLDIQTSSGGCAQVCVDDEYEGSQPAQIPEDIIQGLKLCPGDSDRYEFEALQGQVISLIVSFAEAQGSLSVRLYGPDARLLDERSGGQRSVLVERRVEQSGLHMIELEGVSALVTSEYSLDLWLYEASACVDSRDCDAQSYCEPHLGCVEGSCDESTGCGALHSCVGSAISALSEGGQCRARCERRETCRSEEECKPMPNYETLCIPEGEGQLGAPCSLHSDCVGTLVCVPSVYGVGVCVDAACDAALPCPEEERCVPFNGGSVCAMSCASLGCPGELRCDLREGEMLCVP